MDNYKFSKDHEWVDVKGNVAYIGISDFAQHALGDIVFVELPKTEKKINAGSILASVESVKAVSDVFSPLSGLVKETNSELGDTPELLNQAPYDNWIAAIELENASELDSLMSKAEYDEFCAKEA
jgi:glycine cleavage system H protein